MTVDFFIKNYDLTDFCINSAYIENNKLYLVVVLQPHLDLIANGYRPSLDMLVEKTFVFDVKLKDSIFTAPFSISIDKATIIVNGSRVELASDILYIK